MTDDPSSGHPVGHPVHVKSQENFLPSRIACPMSAIVFAGWLSAAHSKLAGEQTRPEWSVDGVAPGRTIRHCYKNNYSADGDSHNRQCSCGFARYRIQLAKPMVGQICNDCERSCSVSSQRNRNKHERSIGATSASMACRSA
jgi:hypothetical protein